MDLFGLTSATFDKGSEDTDSSGFVEMNDFTRQKIQHSPHLNVVGSGIDECALGE